MNYAKFYKENNGMFVSLPLTQPIGKVRVKERNSFYEYGIPIAARQTKLSLKNYVEWQIGYDIVKNEENLKKTTLTDYEFIDYKNETKLPYELSEILFYSKEEKYISKEDIENTFYRIVRTEKTLDVIDEMQITRTNPISVKYDDVDFYKMNVSYPLVVHKFGSYDIYAEIINREKQRAVGVQPMLYVCLPITNIEFSKNPLGRSLEVKEEGRWIIGREEAKLALELFRIFGMLSQKHKYDVCQILKTLFDIA